ncbi:MAG: NAD(P)/FAD-dependent oxidoreductase [Sporichthyaceae bacterium]|jgi:thioredoxin reductase
MTDIHEVDILIVGAGPVGLFGAYYAGFRNLRTAVMDSLPELGGQISAMYPEKLIYDVAGFPAVKGRELVANLKAQADRFSPVYLTGHRAQDLVRLPDAENGAPRFEVTSDKGTVVRCGIVIVTGGIGNFTPRPLPAGSEFLGRGLAYFVPDLQALTGKDVVIVGGGDSAFDWALGLHEIAKSVTLVHRREMFRAHAHTIDEVRKTDVEIVVNAEIKSVDGNGRVESVVISHAKTGETTELPCQALVAALGFTANLGPLLEWGIEIQDRRHVLVDTRMSTSVRGIFSAGDITEYPGKVRLIVVGFGEVATAVNNAAALLDPEAPVFPGHSTDAAVPSPIGAAV